MSGQDAVPGAAANNPAPPAESASDAAAARAPAGWEPPADVVAIEQPTPEVNLGGSAPPPHPVPGTPRPSFDQLPTGQVGVTAPAAPAADLPEWMRPPDPVTAHRGLAGWALAFSIAGLVVSLFVGWGFPVALVGIVTAAFALRRPVESRPMAGWALALGIVAVLYSLGWLAWAATRTNLFG